MLVCGNGSCTICRREGLGQAASNIPDASDNKNENTILPTAGSKYLKLCTGTPSLKFLLSCKQGSSEAAIAEFVEG